MDQTKLLPMWKQAKTKKEGTSAVNHKLKTQLGFEIRVIRTAYHFPFLLFAILIV